jgi:predicted ATPase/DNA-binding CsgD family transcriptional regulator
MARPFGVGARDDGDPPAGDHLADVVPLGEAHRGERVARLGHRLPAFWSSFVGRSREVEELVSLLDSTRLVTLTGPGGMGKTRLAVEVAERSAHGRAFFVDLAPLREPAQVAEEVASAFGVGELRGRDLGEVLAAEVSAGALLVLDNCEHLISACSRAAHAVLGRCPELQILATSQQRLGVTGESVWKVPALATPAPTPDMAPDEALGAAAVQLFCERAKAVNSDFTASAANMPAIVEICWRLDGNPLAIELAAACTEALSPQDIAVRLKDRFHLLRGGAAGPTRHQTLAAALAWSDELLSEPERTLLRRLSVFAGAFSLRAAERVCPGTNVDPADVLRLLSGLVAKSLVVANTSGSVAVYRLLETVRHYAAEGLAASGEADVIGERHATWCLELTEHGTPDVETPAGQAEYDNVHDNARVALEWCLAHGQAELALRLAAGQMELWQDSGRFSEAREWLEKVVAASGSAPAALRASALHDAGFASFMLGDFEAAHAYIAQSLALWAESGDAAGAERTQGLLGFISTFGPGPTSIEQLEGDLVPIREAGDDARLAEALVGVGHARSFRGEPIGAQEHFQELREVAQRLDDDSMLATALVGLGGADLARGDYKAAAEHLRAGTKLAAEANQIHTHALGTTALAELTRLQGDHAAAVEEFRECLVAARAHGAPYPLASALLGLGKAALDEGDLPAAQLAFEEALAVAGQAGLAHLVSAALDGSGEVACALGDAATARAKFDEALATARQCDDRLGTARATYHLGELARTEDDLTQAVCLHNEALRNRQEVGDRVGVVESLEALAGLAVARRTPEVAARVFGAADGLRQGGGFPRRIRQDGAYQADVAALGGQMAGEDLQRAWGQGRAMSGEQATAYILKGRGSRARPPTGLQSLTPAERDIVNLVCEGLTNPEIAARLFISPRTVQSHLRKVYARLGVTSRRQLRDLMSEGRPPA